MSRFKVIKKALKWIAWSLGSLLLLLLLIIFSLQIPAVQTKVVKYVASYLSGKIGTEVRVGSVNIEPFTKIVVEDVLALDHRSDTMFFIGQLKVSVVEPNFKENDYRISSLYLNKLQFNLIKYKGDSVTNLTTLINRFSSTDTSTSSSKLSIKSGSITINDANFVFRNQDEVSTPGTMNFDDIEVRHLSIYTEDFIFNNDSIATSIKNLSLIEKSGFYIKHFSTEAVMYDTLIKAGGVKIETPHSKLSLGFNMFYKSFDDFSDYNGKVAMVANLRSSKVSMKDIAFFAGPIKGYAQEYTVKGNVHGPVRRFGSDNLDVRMGKNTHAVFSFRMWGLPDADHTQYTATVKSFKSDYADALTVQLPPFDKHEYLKLPEMLKNTGIVHYEGKFFGTFDDYNMDGKVQSQLGELVVNLGINVADDKGVKYKGTISSDKFGLGALLYGPGKSNDLGNVSLVAEVDGQGFDIKTLSAKANASISSLEYKGYRYANISIKSTVAEAVAKSSLTIADSNMIGNFVNTMSFEENVPDFYVDGKLIKANMLATGWASSLDSIESVRGIITADWSGTSISKINGYAAFKKLELLRRGKRLYFEHIAIGADQTNVAKRTLKVDADLFNAVLVTKVELNRLDSYFKAQTNNYVNIFDSTYRSRNFKEDLYADFELINAQPFLDFFAEGIKVARHSTLHMEIDPQATKSIAVQAKTNFIDLYGTRLNDVQLLLYTGEGKLNMNLNVHSMALSDSFIVDQPYISAVAGDNKLRFFVSLNEIPKSQNKARINGEVEVIEGSDLALHLLPSDIFINNEQWKVSENNQMLVHGRYSTIKNIVVSNDKQQISINGNVKLLARSKKEQKEEDLKLSVNLRSFDLRTLNPYTKPDGYTLEGTADGVINIFTNTMQSKAGMSSDLYINNIKVNGDSLGRMTIRSTWDDASKIVSLSGVLNRGSSKIMDISGQYYPNRKNDNLDFDVNIQKLYLTLLAPYIRDILGDLRGQLSAEVKVGGTFGSPSINGTVKLQKTSFVVNYLNTRYNLSDEFRVTDKLITFNNITVNDSKGNVGQVNGRIVHDRFKNMYFDLSLTTKNFQLLNTREQDNNLYYGEAYASGAATLKGPPKKLEMNIDMATERGTRLFIPLNNTEELSNSSLVKFVKKGSKKDSLSKSRKLDLSSIVMDFDLDVRPNAEIKINFDPKIGDVITATGSGNISMQINTQGSFYMYGSYVISKGDYLFTLQNAINKHFTITSGSEIRWNKDPVNAEINMNAVYEVKASLYDIIAEDRYKNLVPVNCELNMTGRLLQPIIKFNVSFPGMDETTASLIRNNIESKGEAGMAEQVFSLLVFNRFISSETNSQRSSLASGLGTTTTTELLSNQLSNYLSSLNSGVDIRVNYRPGDELSQKQLDVALSKKLFNDRLSLNGNLGQAYNQNNTSNILGDFNADYQLSNDGRFRVKAFNRSNVYSLLNVNSPYTQGVGFSYSRDFNKLSDLWERYKKKAKKSNK